MKIKKHFILFNTHCFLHVQFSIIEIILLNEYYQLFYVKLSFLKYRKKEKHLILNLDFITVNI